MYGAKIDYDGQRQRILFGIIFLTTALILVTLICPFVATGFLGPPSLRVVIAYLTVVLLSAHYSAIKIRYVFWILILGDRFDQLTILMELSFRIFNFLKSMRIIFSHYRRRFFQ